METTKFVRKPFPVDAVRVTLENIDEVAAWCGGEVRLGAGRPGRKVEIETYIKVPADRPLNEKQTQAYIGDWVLKAETGGFKVYTNRAMDNSFQKDELPVTRNVFEQILTDTDDQPATKLTFSDDASGKTQDEYEQFVDDLLKEVEDEPVKPKPGVFASRGKNLMELPETD